MLLLAVQKPQKVPRSRSGYQDVRMRAHAGDPRPCKYNFHVYAKKRVL